METCDVCRAPARFRCSRCKTGRYCSKECQKKAWPNHRKQCHKRPPSNRSTIDTDSGSAHSSHHGVTGGRPDLPQEPNREHHLDTTVTLCHSERGQDLVGNWKDLTDDLLLEVFWKLSAIDLSRCACVNRQWNSVSSTKALWTALCSWQDVSSPTSAVREPSTNGGSGEIHGKHQSGVATCGGSLKEVVVSHAAVGSPFSWLRRRRRTSSSSDSEVGCTAISEHPKATYRRAILLQRRLISGQTSENVLCGHSHYVEVTKLTMCPQLGLLLITASWDHDIRVFSCTKGKCIGRFCSHQGWVTCLDVSSGWLVSGGDDGFLCTWQLHPSELTYDQDRSALQAASHIRHENGITACCWLAPGSDLVVSGSRDGAVYVSCSKSSQRLSSLTGGRDAIWGLRSRAVSCPGKGVQSGLRRVVVSSRDCNARTYMLNLTSLRRDQPGTHRVTPVAPEHVLKLHRMPILCMDCCTAPESVAIRKEHTSKSVVGTADASVDVVALGSADSLISLWVAGTGSLIYKLAGHRVGCMSVKLHLLQGGTLDCTLGTPYGYRGPSGAVPEARMRLLLISGGADHAVMLWDAKAGTCLQKLASHAAPVTAILASGCCAISLAAGDCVIVHTIVDKKGHRRHKRACWTQKQDMAAQMSTDGTRLVPRHSYQRCSSLSVSSAVAWDIESGRKQQRSHAGDGGRVSSGSATGCLDPRDAALVLALGTRQGDVVLLRFAALAQEGVATTL